MAETNEEVMETASERPRTHHSSEAAVAYIRALFRDTDHVALLAVPRRPPPPESPVLQRITSAEDLSSARYQAWLRHLNAQGHDLFVGMNPLTGRPRAAGNGKPRPMREKQDVLEVRRLQLDLDKSGAESLQRVFDDVARGVLPRPAAVIRSSARNYQVVWHATPAAWTPEPAEALMRRLADRYDGDSSVADVARVMRLPGYQNKKPGRDDALAAWTDHGGAQVTPADFSRLPEPSKQAAAATPQPAPGASARTAAPPQGDNSLSGQDWAWTREQLKDGADRDYLIGLLEERRQDKHNPADYATRTVLNAEESLWREGRLPR